MVGGGPDADRAGRLEEPHLRYGQHPPDSTDLLAFRRRPVLERDRRIPVTQVVVIAEHQAEHQRAPARSATIVGQSRATMFFSSRLTTSKSKSAVSAFISLSFIRLLSGGHPIPVHAARALDHGRIGLLRRPNLQQISVQGLAIVAAVVAAVHPVSVAVQTVPTRTAGSSGIIWTFWPPHSCSETLPASDSKLTSTMSSYPSSCATGSDCHHGRQTHGSGVRARKA